jgi:hypothetical protein
MKIILEFKHKDINDIRVDYIEDTVNTLLLEKEELDKNITLYWEKKDIYVCKMKAKDTYKILFGDRNEKARQKRR